MTFEELKAEAEKQGYKLIKKRKYVKLLHCPTCGKVPEMWANATSGFWFYRCKCGERAEEARTQTKAKQLWNDKVEREEK